MHNVKASQESCGCESDNYGGLKKVPINTGRLAQRGKSKEEGRAQRCLPCKGWSWSISFEMFLLELHLS